MQPVTPLTPQPLPRAYTSFESMCDEVRIYAPNVSDRQALHVVRLSAIDFCRQTGLWIDYMTPIVGQAMQPEYDIPTPANSIISYLSECWYGSVRIDPQSIEQLKKRYVNDWTDISIYNGPPVWYTHTDLCRIRLVPCPRDNTATPLDAITGFMCLQPTLDSLGMPSEIAVRWIEGIGFGARARLYQTPDTPFYNPAIGAQYERKAMNEIAKAKIQANMARGRGPLTINKKPWPWGA